MNLDEIYRGVELHYSQKGAYKTPYPNGSIEFTECERDWSNMRHKIIFRMGYRC